MALKNQKEWFIDMHWGKLALISYGDPKNPPVLMVHGYLDSAATFLGLLEYFPDKYYYVAFDLPGHGKSYPFPAGNLPSHIHIVEVLRRVVDYMNWNQFILLNHSMAYIIGIYYNAVYPNRISKMINLDPVPPIATNNASRDFYPIYFVKHFDPYYRNFTRWTKNLNRPRYTEQEAVSLISKNRNVTEDQAKAMLSRSLIPDGEGKFIFSWDPKMKFIRDITFSKETLFTLMSENVPPTLNLVSSIQNMSHKKNKIFAQNIMDEVNKAVPHYHSVLIEDSTHDVHCSHPEKIAPYIVQFLNKNSVLEKAKL